jgi:hypothetical protein
VEDWNMKRFFIGLVLAAVVAIAFDSVAASASPNKLLTFGTGAVTVTSADSATIVNGAGEYGGVYINSRSHSAKPLNAVHLSFDSTGDSTGGAPRFSIPIDDGTTVLKYAFIGVLNCGYATGTVSTDLSNCMVNFNGVDYANWDAFATANPSFRIAPGQIPFIIADEPGNYAVSNIDLR